jgi:hypothetical protein
MDRLHEIEIPTLVLAGRHDFLFPPEHQAILADRLPNARLEIVELSGHNPQDEQPEVVIDLVQRFLTTARRIAAPPAPERVQVPEFGPREFRRAAVGALAE